MSDEYTIATNFQRTDDPRAVAEYEYRMGRVREREAEADLLRVLREEADRARAFRETDLPKETS